MIESTVRHNQGGYAYLLHNSAHAQQGIQIPQSTRDCNNPLHTFFNAGDVGKKGRRNHCARVELRLVPNIDTISRTEKHKSRSLLWRAVEGCGRLWSAVEGCGKPELRNDSSCMTLRFDFLALEMLVVVAWCSAYLQMKKLILASWSARRSCSGVYSLRSCL